MSARTLWILLLVAAGLGAAAWWQLEHTDEAFERLERPLLRDLDPARVRALRIDNLERNLQLRLELDEGGRWQIVDPVSTAAAQGVVHSLLRAIADGRGLPAPEPDPAKLHLDPPRVVLEVEQADGAGTRLHRVEVGDVDFDVNRVFVRVEGQVLITSRALDTALERDLHGWRSKRILDVAPHTVFELRRRGSMALEAGGPERDLTLDATLVSGTQGWRAARPAVVQLDPVRTATLVEALARLSAEAFVSDVAPDRSAYGLAPPELSFELSTVDGRTVGLELGRTAAGCHAAVVGGPQVWLVDGTLLPILAADVELLLDYRLLRTPRSAVEELTLESGSGGLDLRRQGESWEVRGHGTDGAPGAWARADRGLVEDLLARLENAELKEVLWDERELPDAAAPGFRAVVGGERVAGRLGAARSTEQGVEGVLFLRAGDEVGFVADTDLLALCGTRADDLRSLELLRLDEWDQARVRVAALDAGGVERATRTFHRTDEGLWTPAGSSEEARDFAPLVDRVLNLRAASFLAADEALDLAGAVRVVVEARLGGEAAYLLAPDPAGADWDFCAAAGSRARLPAGLRTDLLALLDG